MVFDRAKAVDSAVEAEISKTLEKIEEKHRVKILHAVESGSRAWGFHSPNSDYDVRFIYVHEHDWYLTVYPGRDVIELPINDVYDVSGWDLRKTLHLAMKSNAVVMEWLQSPIIYKTVPDFTDQLLSFCGRSFQTKALMYHYINLGSRQIDQAWRTSDTTEIKKYFYMIRPAMALRWMANNRGVKQVPMNIDALMDGGNVPKGVCAIMHDLIAQKHECEEKAVTKRIHELDDFLLDTYEAAERKVAELPSPEKQMEASANDILRQWVF